MLRTLSFSILLTCLLLTSCARSATTPRSQTSQQTTDLSAHTSVASTTSQIAPSTTPPIATPAPTAISASTPVPQEVYRLPLNQPWFLRQGRAMAINRVGGIQQLRASVIKVIERSPLPPLLLTQSALDTFSLIDTSTWRSIPIDVRGDTLLQSFVASPDGRQLAFSATFASTSSDRKAGNQVLTNVSSG
jgi:hypothetical protein